LRAIAFRQLDLSAFDLVLTSSSAESKSVRPRPDALQITYCHSPSHYYWSRYDAYLAAPGLGRLDPLGRLGLRLLAGPMRTADFRAAQHADVVLVNSAHIQSEVARIYRRDSHVVHPPVDVTRIVERTTDSAERRGYVIAGRQTPYKRFDLAIRACTELGRPLLVMGDGPEQERLRALAGPTIAFQQDVPDEHWARLLASADGFLFPGMDDFGITPVEAMAAGTPVIAYRAGGALEYVDPGTTGVFFGEQTVESLVAGIEEFETITFDADKVRAAAERFSSERFRREMLSLISHYLGEPIDAA
jgi:glycosyltransferase involved in cell wall biosynthesis